MASFLSNCVEQINEQYDSNAFEFVDSLNKQCFDQNLVKNAKIIIVGTLTPANGMGYGYYYTSERNKVYGLLDYCFDDNQLVELKKQLKFDLCREQALLKIKQYLAKHKIAFVDVINQAIRKKGSSKDDDIVEYTLDKKSFSYCNNNQKFVCTSKNAKICLDKIAKFDNIVICHQDRFRCDKELWKKELTE